MLPTLQHAGWAASQFLSGEAQKILTSHNTLIAESTARLLHVALYVKCKKQNSPQRSDTARVIIHYERNKLKPCWKKNS